MLTARRLAGDQTRAANAGRIVAQGYAAARLTALSILDSLKRELGDLDRVTEWIRAVGYVHCAPGFGQNATVVDGFSDLIVELWGDAGQHARSAPGQGSSPLNVPIIVGAGEREQLPIRRPDRRTPAPARQLPAHGHALIQR
jgi:hypothetical protein